MKTNKQNKDNQTKKNVTSLGAKCLSQACFMFIDYKGRVNSILLSQNLLVKTVGPKTIGPETMSLTKT